MILTTFPRPRYATPFRSFDRAFDRAFAQLAALSATPSFSDRSFGPNVSGEWVDDSYQLTVDLPGVADDAVAVSVAGRTLTIDVTTDDGSWKQQLRLPQTLDPEQVSARYVNGRLTVTVAKTAQAEARRIAIDTTPAQPELAAPAAETPEAVEATAAE